MLKGYAINQRRLDYLEKAVKIMQEMFKFIAEYEGEVPGADAKSCGNYLDQNLPMQNMKLKNTIVKFF